MIDPTDESAKRRAYYRVDLVLSRLKDHVSSRNVVICGACTVT